MYLAAFSAVSKTKSRRAFQCFSAPLTPDCKHQYGVLAPTELAVSAAPEEDVQSS